jgi:hypothetical protein
MPNTLQYFTVTGNFKDVEQPLPSGTSIIPTVQDVNGYVDFYPGTETEALATGLVVTVADLDLGAGMHGDTELPIAPITGRFIEGKLCTVAIGDPEGVGLLANSAFIGVTDLYYHVRFRNVTYGGALQRLSNFAFLAPTDTTPVLLTSTTLDRLPYRGP